MAGDEAERRERRAAAVRRWRERNPKRAREQSEKAERRHELRRDGFDIPLLPRGPRPARQNARERWARIAAANAREAERRDET